MFTPSRDDARRFLAGAWAKYRAGAPLSGLESMAAGIVALHPEYHAIVENPDHHLDRDYRPEEGDINPFLHLSLHLAVAEQLGIDQPHGIRAHFERLKAARATNMPRCTRSSIASAKCCGTRSATARRPTRGLPRLPRAADVRRHGRRRRGRQRRR